MDQRLGRSDEKEGDGPEEVLQGAEGGTLDTVERRHDEKPGDIAGLYTLLEKTLKSQERDASKQEQRWRSVQIQLNQLRDDVEQNRPPRQASPPPQQGLQSPLQPQQDLQPQPLPPQPQPDQPPPLQHQPQPPGNAHLNRDGAAPVAWSRKAVPRYVEGEDIEQYLTTFERLARAYRWPREDWAVYIVPHLSGKARSAYVAMDINDSMDYARVREAILEKYEINEEVYRRRFREPDVRTGESPKELYQRLKDLFRKWIRPEQKTVEEVAEDIILEQFFRTLSPEVRVWVKEHKPQTGQQAAVLVENFLSARRGPKIFRAATGYQATAPGKSDGFGGGPRPREQSRGNEKGPYRPYRPTTFHRERPASRVVCIHCHKEGHARPDCPAWQPKAQGHCCLPGSEEQKQGVMGRLQTVPVLVGGKGTSALIDTGSSQTLVQPHLVDRNGYVTGGSLTVICVNGDEHVYPVAKVYIEVQRQTYRLTVGVVEGLSHPVVLGQDILILPELVQAYKPVNVVMTRSQAKVQAEEPQELSELRAMPFFDSFEVAEKLKAKKSLRQRRREKLVGTLKKQQDGESTQIEGEAWEDMTLDIKQLQSQDPTLQEACSKVSIKDGVPTGVSASLNGESFVLHGGVLYHQPEGDLAEQLVVPKGLRERALSLGHSIPWSGHLSTTKTFERIAARFYWPGMYRDIQGYCKACSICQITSKQKTSPFPLQPLPIIEVPFTRIGMDIVGPLERTPRGHRYILVVCDYATRYPEAFPLRKVTATTIAQAILQLFSRVGIPQEIITDQGTAFLSKKLKQVYSLLGIKGIRTTPYHPQTDGLVERYNQTLKNMLRKYVSANGKDWDRWLPYLLFAYREVPQASTGFSPFELLYGRPVRGPLDLLKEAWEGPKAPETHSILAHVLQMREKMEEMTELVRSNLEQVQHRQKVWYDKKARQRTLQPGQKVLLLLPTSENKLLAQWQGPYTITRKVGPATYEINMPGRKKPKRVFHINLLKEWRERVPESSLQLMVQAVGEEEDTPEQFFPTAQPLAPLDLAHLTPQQQRELEAIIPPGLCRETPGVTTLVEHFIPLKDSTPVRQRMYRIPERLLPLLKEEVEEMLSLGVIERSHSEWSNPVVLVPKKDGKIRFCIDFRKVNAQSHFDAYPMPRLEDLIERLGKARYITTLDLCKGYWQVPLAEQDQPYTAFRTPQGLFHFLVMPFGLQGAPATFQRLMDRVLEGTESYAGAYLDDIVIYSTTWEDHVGHLADILQRIQKAGLTVHPKKCDFAKPEVRYLGYVLGRGLIKPQKEKVQAIQDCPQPQTQKDVRSFLGLVGWYRRFVADFSTRAAPLSDLTRKSGSSRLQWGAEQERAFSDLKGALCQGPVLQSPDFDKPFTVQTDASGIGLGAVLLQGEGADQRPVAFISRKLFPRETRYAAVELECLAIKWALDTLRYYLLGRDFKLETDHRALQWLGRMKDSNARITRWFLALQPYRFQVQYRAGKQNVVADFLSRHPGGETSEGEGNVRS